MASADRHISNMVQFIYTAANSSTFFLSAKDKFYFGSGTYSLDFREATALGSSVAISDSQISEGDGGTKAMTFTVTRTGGTASFDVDFATLVSDRFLRIVAIPTVPPDNANNGPAGYVPVSGTLHFGEGETTKEFSINVNGDLTPGPDLRFSVLLSNPTNGAAVTKDIGQGTIFDDDTIDDYANKFEDTTSPIGQVAVNGTAEGTLETNYDSDLFAVQLESEKYYQINVSDGAGNLSLYDSTGKFIPESPYDGSPGQTFFNPRAPGTYYIGISGGYYSSGGAYSVSVKPAPAYGSYVSISSENIDEGDSGSQTMLFHVTRTGGAAAFSVNYRTLDYSASSFDDYVAASGTLDFGDGVNSLTIPVTIYGDTEVEQDEVFEIQLYNPTDGAQLYFAKATGRIADDDTPDDFADGLSDKHSPIGELTIGSAVNGAFELSGDRDVFAVKLDAGTIYVFTADIRDNYGSRVNWGLISIYDSANQLLTGDSFGHPLYFKPDVAGTYYVSTGSEVPIIGHYTLAGTATAIGASVSIADVRISEGNNGTRNALFTVTRTGASAAFSVNYETQDIIAKSGSDYVATSGTLQFVAGETSKTISVSISGDTQIEPAENFSIYLSGITNGASILKDYAYGIIHDDDNVDDYADNIGDVSAPLQPLAVDETAVGTLEIAGDEDWFAMDLQAGRSYILDIRPETYWKRDMKVSVLNKDGVVIVETFFYSDSSVIFEAAASDTYYAAVSAAYNETGRYSLQIIEATAVGSSVAIGDASVEEGNDGSRLANFTVTRTGTSAAFDLDFETFPDYPGRYWASSGYDYFETSGTLHFAEGENTKVISITITGDERMEHDETFTVNLSGATRGANISDSFGRGTIIDDDDKDDFADSLSDESHPIGVLSIGHTQSGSIDLDGDTDWFSIQLKPSSKIVLQLEGSWTGAGTLPWPELKLYTATGSLISQNSFAAGGWNAQLTYAATEAGTLFVSAGGVSVTTGNFKLTAYDADSVHFDNGGNIDYVDYTEGNGLRTIKDIDNLHHENWSHYFQYYDAAGNVDYCDYSNYNSTRLLVDNDNLDNQNWSQLQQVFDAQGREDYRDYRLDDGRRQINDYDQAGDQSWNEAIQLYDTQGREDYRDYRLKDGTRQLNDYDQDGNQSWREVIQLYDTQGREDYRDYRMDDGSRVFTDYDQALGNSWTLWQKEFAPDGSLVRQIISYDNGTILTV